MKILKSLTVTGAIKFVPQDLWIGVYWKYDKGAVTYFKDGMLQMSDYDYKELHLYITVVPTFPLHLTIIWW